MKTKNIQILTLSLLFAVTACKDNKKEAETETQDPMPEENVKVETSEASKKITFKLEPKSDSNVSGNAVFKEESGFVTFTAVLEGLEEGEHAIHIHEKSDCSSPDGKSTGGHWNPTNQPHGKWGSSNGYHKGDIGNFKADSNGNGTITITTDEWCIGCGDPNKDIIGKAIIVHQGVDDFTTQPTGNAGGRISCGGIIQ